MSALLCLGHKERIPGVFTASAGSELGCITK